MSSSSGMQTGEATGQRLAALALAALGVVYGDIGTSPLYAVKEVFAGNHPIPVTVANIYGSLSLFFWALIVVVSVKYVTFIMRADNRGEGGIMALIALALRDVQSKPNQAKVVVILGVLGAAMFYGDGMVTPAISVLSAVEGLEVATPTFKPYVIPITLLVLFVLFYVQRHGTALVGTFFGPVMLLWFGTLAGLGLYNVIDHPAILHALNPAYGIGFLLDNKAMALVAMGNVVLAEFVTGTPVERLCADLAAVVPGRVLDDDCNILLRFGGGARGVLIASQISAGARNGLTIKVYGEKGGLTWSHERHTELTLDWLDGPSQVLHAGSPYLSAVAQAASRIPTGHPEGFIEAFANIYRDFARAVGGEAAPLVPGIAEGVRGMAFVERAVAASRDGLGWVELEGAGR